MSSRESTPGWYEVGYINDLADPKLNRLLPHLTLTWARKRGDDRLGAYAYVPASWHPIVRGVDRVVMVAANGKPPVGVHSMLLVLATMARRYGIDALRVTATGGAGAVQALWDADPWPAVK